jgi:transcriptional regulator with XRE-family HTH domain
MAHRVDPQLAFGRAVTAIRLRKKQSKQSVANRGQLSERWIRDVEEGRTNPTLANIRRIAKGLRVDLEELMRVTEECEREIKAEG